MDLLKAIFASDFSQQFEIDDLQEKLHRESAFAARQRMEARDRLSALELENEQLKLALGTVIYALRSRDILTDVELRALERTLSPKEEVSSPQADPTDTSAELEQIAKLQQRKPKPQVGT